MDLPERSDASLEPMTASPPGHGVSHTAGSQSQFLPGYLLGDNLSHSMSSPRLWSASALNPGHKSSHSPHGSAGRPMSRGEAVKGRSGGPPTRGFLSSSTTDPSSLPSPAQTRTPGSAAARVASPGPPTTGLFGTPVARGDVSMNQSSIIPSSPSQLDPFYTQGESLRSDDVLDETWVTVFGFPPGAISFILQQFSQYGNILKHVASAEGNWMHVHYQSKLQAKKALSKNGKVYGGRMMIGVLPCIDKNVMANKENADLCSTPITPQLSSAELNSSMTNSGTPIRPLIAAYSASRSEYEVMKNKQTPQKDNSIVTKVKEYMFGW
ncbi:nucleoporin NUP35-like isoform X2 [Babylonia areolata]|uniref:nucleoporin NUP35-like isoform X2 n=1 Tax=Babylonia areolata TaxID=304850 RepID=UPI003FCFF23A